VVAAGTAAAPDVSPAAAPTEARPDLRILLLGAAGWGGALVALLAPVWAAGALVAAGLAALLLCWRRGLPVWVLAGCLLAATAVGAGSLVRLEATRTGPVARLADQHAYVHLTARVASDPIRREGRFGPFVRVSLEVSRVSGRGRVFATSARILVMADAGWALVALGETVEASGRLQPADEPATAAVMSSGRPPVVVSRPGPVLDAAEAVRAGIRSSLAGSSPQARTLVPALVVGDDRAMSAEVVEDFRTCGLTHLAAVSGTNLTLVVGFLLVIARWGGVRSRGLVVVGALGVAGFVVVARAEPSVVRAAAMGTVALIGMGAHGRRQGVRALGVATLALLLVDPWLAISFGFALSVLATAGILFLAPTFRDQLCAWLPRWAAEALAVPLAAQLVCTPVVAALSGQVSLVAVLANMVVAPAVAPAMVLGLVGGLVSLVVPAAGALCGWAAGLFGWWIVAVATHLARLPVAAVDWPVGPWSLLLLSLLCLAATFAAGFVLRRRWAAVVTAVLLVFVLLRPLPSPGWPPPGWVLVACDVGQGDGLVLNAGPGRAVVIDTGPDPELMDRCLTRLGVDSVPTVVLTHFHADHVDGLPGVLSGRTVGEVEVTGLREPPEGASAVDRWAAAAKLPVRVPAYGEVREVGPVSWQVIWPASSSAIASEGSTANNASVVLLVQTRGLRILAAGDVEPEAQHRIAESLPGLQVDVLKVPHHGSRHQDAAWLSGLRSRLALVSVGAENDYGHPAQVTLNLLTRSGALVARTDRRGDIAVVLDGPRLRVASR
jgi:competence protein ComEC